MKIEQFLQYATKYEKYDTHETDVVKLSVLPGSQQLLKTQLQIKQTFSPKGSLSAA